MIKLSAQAMVLDQRAKAQHQQPQQPAMTGGGTAPRPSHVLLPAPLAPVRNEEQNLWHVLYSGHSGPGERRYIP